MNSKSTWSRKCVSVNTEEREASDGMHLCGEEILWQIIKTTVTGEFLFVFRYGC